MKNLTVFKSLLVFVFVVLIVGVSSQLSVKEACASLWGGCSSSASDHKNCPLNDASISNCVSSVDFTADITIQGSMALNTTISLSAWDNDGSTTTTSACSDVSCLKRAENDSTTWTGGQGTTSIAVDTIGCSSEACLDTNGQDLFTVSLSSTDPNCTNPAMQTVDLAGTNGTAVTKYFTFICVRPPAQTCTIQGYKVIMPNNQPIEPAASQTVTVSGRGSTTNNPYSFLNIPGESNYTVSVPSTPPTGYLLNGYTLCTNSTTCHNNTTPTSGSSVSANCPAGGYVDIYWHYTAQDQFATIGGRTTNTNTGTGIANVQLTVYNSTSNTYRYPLTDYNGYFRVTDLVRSGNYYAVRAPLTTSSGSLELSPERNYENQQQGSGDCGTSCNFTYRPIPVGVDLKANGSDSAVNIASGERVTLSWTTTNASSCTASSNPSDSVWNGLKSANNTTTSLDQQTSALSGPNTYTYTLSCTNSAGTLNGSDSVSVNVAAPITCNTFSVNPDATSLTIGGSSQGTFASGVDGTVSWSTGNSNIARISSTTGNNIQISPGTQSGTTTITATDNGGTNCSSQTDTVSVTASTPLGGPGTTPPPVPTAAPGAAAYIVEGVVFIDANRNRAKDAGEQCYDGPVRVSLGTTSINHNQDSACTRKYRFTGIPVGTYYLIMDPISSYEWGSAMLPPWTVIFSVP